MRSGNGLIWSERASESRPLDETTRTLHEKTKENRNPLPAGGRAARGKRREGRQKAVPIGTFDPVPDTTGSFLLL